MRAPHRRQFLQATLLATLAPVLPAQANTAAPAALPGGIPAGLQALLPQARLAGAGKFVFWGFDVYNAALWVAPEFRRAAFWQSPFALELAYLRKFEGKAIAKRSIDEMRRAGPLSPEQASQWDTAMREVFPDVAAGDTITGLHLPGVGARFLVNGKPAGTVADPAFSQRFFGIWLAESTSAPALRQALLAQAPP